MTRPKVDVYWNLHRNCWSVRLRGKVVTHRSKLVLTDVSFVVRPAGQALARRTRRKNVHAFARGTLVSLYVPRCFVLDEVVGVTYNPFRDDTFVTLASPSMSVKGAKVVLLDTGINDRHVPVGFHPIVLAKGVS